MSWRRLFRSALFPLIVIVALVFIASLFLRATGGDDELFSCREETGGFAFSIEVFRLDDDAEPTELVRALAETCEALDRS